MYLTTFIATALGVSGLVTAIQLPNLDGAFTKRQVQHPNGSTVDVYLRDSFRHTNKKRFWKTFHNDTEYSHTDICFETNFVPTTTADSALCDDCSAIETELKNNSGFFETGDYSGTDLNIIAVCGTCAFGVKRLDGQSGRVDIGSRDVVDNFDSAIIRFARGGHVGVTGNFTCESVPINWAIVRAP
ncbi:putative necrosis-inducing factor-domain-containing protein [Daldinia caldariorum]|uniref:putative necrosis-inducing factor-domain-containing protein n=1 Tax=Daldinia caldariorum TaxID=326644 RepID=UPI00200776F1|nr:putative necrosis-inducing factor-domain-containing protein [Daldinia caldariorum]KAI1463016.1 putative necrosis-inducing factor-domain-containing protein [Daldinia caldariorum]